MDTLADRLKAWRSALGVTQEEFSARTGIPRRTVVGYENAEREPGASALAGIAQTGVNMTWLLTGEGRMSGLPSSTQGVAALDGADERWGKIIALVQSVPFEDRDALISDFFARARQAAEMERLKQAVLEMQARMGD